jgi:putative phosphoesterase
MKIYSIADIHGFQYRLNVVLKNIQRINPDLVVICGDITQFGPADVAKNFLDQINVETFAVTGNIDSNDVERGIDNSKATRIELKRVVKKGIPFVGSSGINPDDFKIIEKKKMIDYKTILVTHVPPFNTVDKIFIGMHGGSKELRKLVDKFNPKLVLSGHIHEDSGFKKINNTIFVNCSLGKRGEGAIIEINEDVSVKML